MCLRRGSLGTADEAVQRDEPIAPRAKRGDEAGASDASYARSPSSSRPWSPSWSTTIAPSPTCGSRRCSSSAGGARGEVSSSIALHRTTRIPCRRAAREHRGVPRAERRPQKLRMTSGRRGDRRIGLADLRVERARREDVQVRVRLRVVFDLVAVGDHPPQQRRLALRGAPDDEERRGNALALEDVEQPVRDAAGRPVVERQRDAMPRPLHDHRLERAAARRLDDLVQREEPGGEQRAPRRRAAAPSRLQQFLARRRDGLLELRRTERGEVVDDLLVARIGGGARPQASADPGPACSPAA